MTKHIPTIQDMNRKSARELQAMFRKVASVSSNEQCADAERDAARQTMDNIRSILAVRHPRP